MLKSLAAEGTQARGLARIRFAAAKTARGLVRGQGVA